MNPLRIILILALTGAAMWLGTHVAHHTSADAFQALYLHLAPANLLLQGEPIAIGIPGFLNAFTLLLNKIAPEAARVPADLLYFTNLQLFQITAVVLIFVVFGGVASHIRTGRGDVISRLFGGFALWIRDEMVYPVMGRDLGRKFLPYFLCIFFFILFQNLFGLVPMGVTATASIAVTAALALTTFLAMLGCGMAAQGPVAFWKNLLPHGLPLVLIPLMFVVELIGLCVKPFALMIRLFANMTGGHLIVLSCMGLIMFFAGGGTNAVAGWSIAPVAVGFAAFIMIIETFVALLQAYIFTMLSIIFVNMSVHPEH